MVAGTGLVRRESYGAAADRGARVAGIRVWAERGIVLAAYAWIVERILVGLLAEVGGGPLV